MKCVSKTMSSVLEKFADIFNENMIFTSFEEFALLLDLFITVCCLVSEHILTT